MMPIKTSYGRSITSLLSVYNTVIQPFNVPCFRRIHLRTIQIYLMYLKENKKFSHRIPSLKDDLSEQIFKAPFV